MYLNEVYEEELNEADWEYLGDNEYNYALRREELKRNPTLKKNRIFKLLHPDKMNEAQTINQYYYTDRFGKQRVKTYGNIYKAVDIANKKVWHFGSISEYHIETLPQSYLHHLKIEKITLNQDSSSYRGIDLISRRFASKIIQEWARLKGIRYYTKNKKSHALNLVCHKNNIYKDEPYEDDIYTITGEELILLIEEIIMEIRDGNPRAFNEFVELVNNPRDVDEIIVLKKSIWKDSNNKYIIEEDDNPKYLKWWRFPRYNMEYLFSILKELQSGRYYLDVPIIVIKDLYHFPIKCTDLNQCKDNKDFKEKAEIYKANKFVFERR